MFDRKTPLRTQLARLEGGQRATPNGAGKTEFGPFECTLWHPAVLAVQRYVRKP